MTKLFVGGLPYSYANKDLEELFSKFGQVASAAVITDKFTNQSKGFGFVEMEDDAAAQSAIKELDGSDLNGRKLGVSVARPREDSGSRPSYSNNSNRDSRDSGFKRGGSGFNRGGGGGRR